MRCNDFFLWLPRCVKRVLILTDSVLFSVVFRHRASVGIAFVTDCRKTHETLKMAVQTMTGKIEKWFRQAFSRKKIFRHYFMHALKGWDLAGRVFASIHRGVSIHVRRHDWRNGHGGNTTTDLQWTSRGFPVSVTLCQPKNGPNNIGFGLCTKTDEKPTEKTTFGFRLTNLYVHLLLLSVFHVHATKSVA